MVFTLIYVYMHKKHYYGLDMFLRKQHKFDQVDVFVLESFPRFGGFPNPMVLLRGFKEGNFSIILHHHLTRLGEISITGVVSIAFFRLHRQSYVLRDLEVKNLRLAFDSIQ